MKKIKVYGNSFCSVCRTVKEYLKSKGIEFEDIDILKNEEGKKEFQEFGFKEMPVLVKGEKIVVGFKKKEIDALLSD